MAIRIQREVGGNLAELLTTVSGTLRERESLRRQVKVLSAEGRLSGWILGLLPPAFALYLMLARPSYLEPLVTEALGWLLIGVGVVLLAIGALWMRKAVKVEV
jgi:tight adherence protein B